MKRYTLYIIYVQIALMFCFASCKNEDDLDKIFQGRTWYMTGGVIQGKPISGELLKTFYKGDNLYCVSFGENTLTGTLSAGTTFSGEWQADGKKQTMSLTIPHGISSASTFDEDLYNNVLKRVTRYKGDENIMSLYADDYNYINFDSRRTAESPY